MDLTHTFTVPAPIDVTWEAFNDIESVAGCFPGATVTSVEGDEFKGSCKVKLGPIALVYNGTGKFLSKDAEAHKFVVEAKGKDKRGNGTAGATVTASFSSPTPESTEVSVVTDLAITGRPAQFGRGVMQDVSDKLLQAFVDCLQTKVGSSGEEDEPPPGKHSARTPEVPPTPEVSSTPAVSSTPDVPATPEVAPGAADEPTVAGLSHQNGFAPGQDDSGTKRPPRPGSAPPQGVKENDALDLGATMLPILLKSYWRQGLGVVVVVLLLRRLIRR